MEELALIGCAAADKGDLPVANLPSGTPGLKNFEAAYECITQLKAAVLDSLKQGNFPLVLGGDHFTVVGSVAAALEHSGPEMSLLWMDAHADINTPSTSYSGNLHGMPVAAMFGLPSGVSGLEDEQWRRLTGERFTHHLKPEHTAWFGIRDLDPLERARIKELPKGFVASMHGIDRHGLEEMLIRYDRWLRDTGTKHVWFSFDVDALDSTLAPGSGTPVRGGLSYREMHLVGELLHEMLRAKDCPYQLIGMDLVETNPLTDTNNVTARMGVEWIASIFGKVILDVAI